MHIARLLEPGRIGPLELKNRIIYSAMDLRSTDQQGHMTPEAVESLVYRAGRGPGLVNFPGVFGWANPGSAHGRTLSLMDDTFIPPLADAVRRVHAAGAKAMLQLGARGTRLDGGGETTAPSAMRFGYEAQIPRELTLEEIEERISLMGDMALRCRKAGFDAAEVHACTGKLISMFLSPYSNHRTDCYGGSTENRARFLTRILTDMRRKAGEDFPLVVRLTVDDMLPGGIDQDEGVALVRHIAPLCDAVQVSAGTQERIWNLSCGYFCPSGYLLPLTARVKAETGVTVIAMGKLGEPALAVKAVAEGMADFVTLGRPLLVDPDWIAKAASGDKRHIRRCIGCLNCFTFNSRPAITPAGVSCTVFPGLLREETFFEPHPVQTPRSVLVAGGGLAGMEAAATLAERGHNVQLVEKALRLGGQWIAASQGEDKGDYRTLLPFMSERLVEAGVEVRTGVTVNAAYLREHRPDVVVLATGAVPRELPLPRPHPGPRLLQGVDVLLGAPVPEKRIVVVGGRYIGCEAATLLARQGKHVSVVDMAELGQGTNPRLMGVYRNHMVEAGVYLYPNSPILRLTPEGVDVAHIGSMLSLPAEVIVTAIGTVPVTDLKTDLEALGIPWIPVGDCKRIGDALYAIRDGAEIGRTL